jgi:hypothetical protein
MEKGDWEIGAAAEHDDRGDDDSLPDPADQTGAEG